jgi:hypothetical protein
MSVPSSVRALEPAVPIVSCRMPGRADAPGSSAHAAPMVSDCSDLSSQASDGIISGEHPAFSAPAVPP